MGNKKLFFKRWLSIILAIYFVASVCIILHLEFALQTKNREETLKEKQVTFALAQIQTMPEETEADMLQKKALAEKTIAEYISSDNLPKMLDILRQTQQKIEDNRLYRSVEQEVKSEKNYLKVWCRWSALRQKVNCESCQSDISKQIAIVQNKFTGFLISQKGELTQLIQEDRIEEIVSRVTPKILTTIAEGLDVLKPSEQNQDAWYSLITTYNEFLYEKNNLGVSARKQDISTKWEQFRQKFSRFLPRFASLMYQREYDKAQDGLEKFWQAIHSMDEIDTQDLLVVQVRNKLREVQSVKALFSIANEGAKKSVGQRMEIVLKNSQTVRGNVIKYALGCFEIQTDNTIVKIKLKELQSQTIVSLAYHSQNDMYKKYIVQYSGILHLYEKEYDLAQQAFSNALKYGANPIEIRSYIQTVQEEVVKQQR